MSSTTPYSLLAGALTDIKGAVGMAKGLYRRYEATLRTAATIAGITDTRVRTITYEVGHRYTKLAETLSPAGDDTLRIDATYRTNTLLSEEFAAIARKYTNFASTFSHSSLAGVVERLARGLAACAGSDSCDSNMLRGHMPLHVQAITTMDGPVNSLVSTVFIPRLVDTAAAPHTFSVIANAVCGAGGCVATDMLEIDANTRRPIIETVAPGQLATAIVEALRIIGANMVAADQGPLFALALTQGIHRALTVVGHTDEGGYCRDILRVGGYGAPHGGIHVGLPAFCGIPTLRSASRSDTAAYVDGVALMTAALAAHADPGTMHDDTWFPTFSCAADTGDNEQANMAHHMAYLRTTTPAYVREYIDGLCKLFLCDGDRDHAAGVWHAQTMELRDSRHLRYPTVTPYFWIEPTSLIPRDYLQSAAEVNGCGSLATAGEPATMPLWRSGVTVSGPAMEYSCHTVTLPFARTSGALLHMNAHERGSLGAVTIRQCDPAGLFQTGLTGTADEAIDRGASIQEYMWKRGQSPISAPGEFLNQGITLGIAVQHYTYADSVVQCAHVPDEVTFRDGAIQVWVSRPHGRSPGPSNYRSATVTRHVSRAAREFAAVSQWRARFGTAMPGYMPIKKCAPPRHTPSGTTHEPPGNSDTMGGATLHRSTACARAGSGTFTRATPSGAQDTRGSPKAPTLAAQVPATTHHRPTGGPAPATIRAAAMTPVADVPHATDPHVPVQANSAAPHNGPDAQ